MYGRARPDSFSAIDTTSPWVREGGARIGSNVSQASSSSGSHHGARTAPGWAR